MVAKRIVACLDVDGGHVVKGVRFQDLQTLGDPVELARRYSESGADEIVFLDISATFEARQAALEVVRATAENVLVPLTVGGGVRSVPDANRLLRAGADKVAINTAAIHQPGLIADIAREYGSQCVVAAIDARRQRSSWQVFTHGGRRATSLDAVDWARRCEALGAGEILLTSIDSDGARSGYDLALTGAVAGAVGIPLIASGGCGSPEDAYRVLSEAGADAALVAGLFHTGAETPASLKRAVRERGVEVRP